MHSGKCAAALSVAALTVTLVWGVAADDDSLEAARAIRDQAAALQQQAPLDPAWGEGLPAVPRGADAAGGTATGASALDTMWTRLSTGAACRDLGDLCPTGAAPAGSPAPPEAPFTLLVSRALGTATLRSIFQQASGQPVRIVFRGVAPDETLGHFLTDLRTALTGLDPVPSVEIDPRPFAAVGASVAPILIATTPDGASARVAGLTDPAWLSAQLRAGARGDLGTRGPTVAISEVDLISELKRRAARIDWNSERDRALGRFWERVAFQALPPVVEARERRIDPTLVAGADITLPDGQRLVSAGERVNPLEQLAFRYRLIVFDASDPRQVALAHREGQRGDGKLPLYLASALDRTGGWDGLRKMEDAFNDPVYLLTPDVRARFGIERVPSIVEAAGTQFVIREVQLTTTPP